MHHGVFKLLVLSDQQCKTQRCSVFNDIRKKKKQVLSEMLAFFLGKMLN